MIVVDKRKRISAEKALKHDWFSKILSLPSESLQVLNKDVLERLREFKGSSKLKKAALNVLVKMLNPTEIEYLRTEF
jgi:hypothetical protein